MFLRKCEKALLFANSKKEKSAVFITQTLPKKPFKCPPREPNFSYLTNKTRTILIPAGVFHCGFNSERVNIPQQRSTSIHSTCSPQLIIHYAVHVFKEKRLKRKEEANTIFFFSFLLKHLLWETRKKGSHEHEI